MNVSPLKRYPKPRYPTRAVLDEHPELLRLVPERWRQYPPVLAALGIVCTLVYGFCAQDEKAKSAAPATRVAPLFAHGTGSGAWGCVVLTPPVFLSEAEAGRVIRAEAKRAGIEFADSTTVIQGVTMPAATYAEPSLDTGARRSHASGSHAAPGTNSLRLDGLDAKRQIAYEFVSREDLAAWHIDPGYPSTVSEYPTKHTAEELRAGLAETHAGLTVGVFYDPLHKDEHSTARTAQDDLAAQVRDFVKWLKGQGVI